MKIASSWYREGLGAALVVYSGIYNIAATVQHTAPVFRLMDYAMLRSVKSHMFVEKYKTVFDGDERWQQLPAPTGSAFAWDDTSTYIRKPSFFDDLGPTPKPLVDIKAARVLAILGDSVTTDHISPAGSIKPDSPAGLYLQSHGVVPREFNSYGARRGNHEVMMRGTFANIRLRNQIAPGTEGGVTKDFTKVLQDAKASPKMVDGELRAASDSEAA